MCLPAVTPCGQKTELSSNLLFWPEDTDAIIAEAMSILESRAIYRTPKIGSPEDLKRYVRLRLNGLEHEVFTCIYLDTRHRIIACEELFRGTIDGCSVHPREVAKAALAHNASAVIFTHNHLCVANYYSGRNRCLKKSVAM
jgi:DNA repair protein RadC